MRAIVLDHFGGLDSLVIKEIPEPEPELGKVVIQVKAFGINHAEMHMRRGEWAEAAPVSGIECVGIVKSCSSGEFAVGSKVAALMGGLGRTINGSYAEYTRANVSGVVQLESNLPWEELAALPESYATAWTCLFRNLKLVKGQTLLIRGATSSFGLAALNLAVEAGVRVIATTRSRDRFKKLEDLGAHRLELEGPELSTRIAEAKQIDAVLDLVGNSTILDSLRILRRGGRACLAGWLGGLAPIADFNPLSQMPSGVYLTFFASFVFGTPGFPLSDVPLQEIAKKVEQGKFQAKLPETWANDKELRKQAGVPKEISFQTKPDIALGQIRSLVNEDVPRGVVLADAAYGNDNGFREGLVSLELCYAVGIQSSTTLWPPGIVPLPPQPKGKMGRPPRLLRRDQQHQPLSAKDLALCLSNTDLRKVSWREGTRGMMRSRFAAVRVRVAHRDYWRKEPHPEQWLLIEWPTTEKEPTKYWLSNLHESITLRKLVAIAKLRWRIERDYEELKQELGLGHFEGRNWRGFHHHATLSIAAYSFLVLERWISYI